MRNKKPRKTEKEMCNCVEFVQRSKRMKVRNYPFKRELQREEGEAGRPI